MKIRNSWIISLITVAVLVVVATGASFAFNDMTQDGQMTGCPLMGMPVICDMNVQEHISAWQNMFSAIPTQILLLLLLLFVAGPIFRYLVYKPPRFLYSRLKERFLIIPNHLQEAFANGLINSKAY